MLSVHRQEVTCNLGRIRFFSPGDIRDRVPQPSVINPLSGRSRGFDVPFVGCEVEFVWDGMRYASLVLYLRSTSRQDTVTQAMSEARAARSDAATRAFLERKAREFLDNLTRAAEPYVAEAVDAETQARLAPVADAIPASFVVDIPGMPIVSVDFTRAVTPYTYAHGLSTWTFGRSDRFSSVSYVFFTLHIRVPQGPRFLLPVAIHRELDQDAIESLCRNRVQLLLAN